MSLLPTVNLSTGKIKFTGSVRGVDEYGHDVFEVTLPGHATVYGDWNSRFDDNGHDFIVEILAFGYLKISHLGSTNPNARHNFSDKEISIIEDLVRALFASEEARKAVPPFTSPTAVYRGTVVFRPGWISRKPESPGL